LEVGGDNNILTSHKLNFSAPWQQESRGSKKDRSAKYEGNIITNK